MPWKDNSIQSGENEVRNIGYTIFLVARIINVLINVIVYRVEEYLCVGANNRFGFWVMKVYGVQESWIWIWNDKPDLPPPIPFLVWDNGGDGIEIVVFSKGQRRVFCRDREGNITKEFVFDKKNDEYLFTYAETPVSPVYFNSPIYLTTGKLIDPKVCRLMIGSSYMYSYAISRNSNNGSIVIGFCFSGWQYRAGMVCV